MSPQTWAGINAEVLGQPGPQMLDMLRRFSLVAAVVQDAYQLPSHLLIQPMAPVLHAAPLRSLPEPTTQPDTPNHLDIRRCDRLGGILHEDHHAT